MRPTLETPEPEKTEAPHAGGSARRGDIGYLPKDPDGPYRPDIGLRNGILISIALWAALLAVLFLL